LGIGLEKTAASVLRCFEFMGNDNTGACYVKDRQTTGLRMEPA
jgi:hypothetical protein